jgi:hypothetical protein
VKKDDVGQQGARQQRAWERRQVPVSHTSELRADNHLRGRDVHHKFNGGKIVGERESILNQLQQRQARRPHIGPDSVGETTDAFRLDQKNCQLVPRHKRTAHKER